MFFLDSCFSSWQDASYNYKQEILIFNQENVVETNMTIPLRINDSFFDLLSFNWSTQENSIRFTWINESGLEEEIPYWVEWWDDINLRAQLWIQLPQLYSSGDDHFGFGPGNHKVFLYYSNSTPKTSLSNKRDTFLIFDSMDSLPTGNFYGDAVYIPPSAPNPGYARITRAVNTLFGGMHYSISFAQGIAGEFDFWTGGGTGADSVWLGIHNNIHPTAEDIVRGGYHFTFDEYQNRIAFTKSSNDNGGSLAQISHPSIDDSTWRHVEIEYLNDGITARGLSFLDDVLIINHTDGSPQPTTGNLFGFYGRTGGSNNEHRIRGLSVRKILWNMPIINSIQTHRIPELKLSIEPNMETIVLRKDEVTSINIILECLDSSGNNCGDVSVDIDYNDTSSTYADFHISSNLPFWTSSPLPISCILNSGENCSVNFPINSTGIANSLHKLKFLVSNNESLYKNITKIQKVKIVDDRIVLFNQSVLDFKIGYKDNLSNFRNVKIKSLFGDNEFIQISCDSGSCSKITTNFSNGIDLNNNEESEVSIFCNSSSLTTYYSRFKVVSNNSVLESYLDVICEVKPTIFEMIGQLEFPLPFTNNSVTQNKTKELKGEVMCVGNCSEINAYAIFYDSSWWASSFLHRQKITLDIDDAISSGYQILLKFDDSDVGSNFNWNKNCADVRMVYEGNLLNQWIEECDNVSKTAAIWIKFEEAVGASSTREIYMYYDNLGVSKFSNVNNVFYNNSIHLVTGECLSSDAGCNPMSNNGDADRIRQRIGSSASWEIYGQGQRTSINDFSNPFGPSTNYFSRYRTLFVPQITMDYTFAVASSEGSEVGFWNYDGYGYGLSTPSAQSNHNIWASWYNSHASAPCGSIGVKSTQNLIRNKGYWLDYIQQDRNQANTAQLCIKTIGLFEIADTTNYPGQFFSRKYVENEPSISSFDTEENSIIPTSYTPTLQSNSLQPQTCTPTYGGSCNFTWIINATGPINSSYNVSIVFVSSNSDILSEVTSHTNFNIVATQVPLITLYKPVDNFKNIGNLTQEFIWSIEDDTNVNCTLYVDSINVYSGICNNSINNSLNLNFSNGNHSWYVYAKDPENNEVTSVKLKFYLILNKMISKTKSIKFENANHFKIDYTISNLLNWSINEKLIDYVDINFNPGSFSPNFDSKYDIGLEEYIFWNQSINNNSKFEGFYSIVGVEDYFLKNNFVIGID